MKLIPTLIYSILCLITFSCSIEDKKTTIDINCKECVGLTITLTSTSLLRNTPKELYRSTFDSSGIAHIPLNHTDTLTAFLSVGKSDTSMIINTPLYLEPGTNITLNYHDETLTFTGDLELVNSYRHKLLTTTKEREVYINENTSKYWDASDKEKEQYLSKIRSYTQELNQLISADAALPNYYKELLINFNSSAEITKRLSYTFKKANDIWNETAKAPDPILQNIFKDLTLNPYLANNSFYLIFVAQNIGVKIANIWEYHDEHSNKIKTSKYEYIKTAIELNPELLPYKELILALSLSVINAWDWISYDQLLELNQAFEKDYPRSKHLSELHEMLAERSTLRPGTQMKDFVMQDVTGKDFKLSDLKGNLIYMDVWATWCGPCKEELKHSVKLSKKYANHTDLKFLYVSVDNKRELWESFLKKNPSIKGIHGIQSMNDPADTNDVWTLYQIRGIPRYILFDKGGKIIDSSAARPSQLLTTNYLDSLLAL